MPKEPDLPEHSAEFRAAIRRVVWPWAIPGLVLGLAGALVLFLTAFSDPLGYGLFGLGLGLEIHGMIRGRRFRRDYIAAHPI